MEAPEEEDSVFVCGMPYSTLNDSSTTDQDEKTSGEEASTSSSSSVSDSTPGSPTPLVPGEQIVDVGHNCISFTQVKHSPLFRTRLPHLSAHSLALSAGSRKQRYPQPQHATEGQYAQPESYDKWSKQRGQNSKWSKRQQLERPLLLLASVILVMLLIAGIMIAVFWVPGSSKEGGTLTPIAPMNTTNMTTTWTSRNVSTDVSATTTSTQKQPPSIRPATSTPSPSTSHSTRALSATKVTTTTIATTTTQQTTTQQTSLATTMFKTHPPPVTLTPTVSLAASTSSSNAQNHTTLVTSSTTQSSIITPAAQNTNISVPIDATGGNNNSTEQPP